MEKNNEFKSMAKSSGIVAFVQVFRMIFGVLKNKAIALMLGPAGFGVWSLYYTFIEMLSTFSVLGLDQGGVREIAKSTSDKEEKGKTIFTFQIAILVLSVLFGIVVFAFARQFSEYLFHSAEYTDGIRFLSFVVVFYGVAKGGYAILNGVRALRYIAFSQIAGTVVGAIGAVLLIAWGGEKMIAPALSVVTITLAVTTMYYVRKLRIKIIATSFSDFMKRFHSLISLGLGFTVAGVAATVTTMLSRSYLSASFSLDAVGIYQAGWTISNLYIGLILTAMGIDFMPRISKVSDDNAAMNEMINKQIEFGVVMSVIGVAFILLLAPQFLQVLYSSKFVVGVSIIRWQILGVFLRIVAFPFSYAIMAKKKPVLYAVIQCIFWTSDYLLLMLFSHLGGFDALGVNFFVAYCGYLAMAYCTCRSLHSFRFSRRTIVLTVKAVLLIIMFWLLSFWGTAWALLIGILLLVMLCLATYRYAKREMGIDLISFFKSKFVKK